MVTVLNLNKCGYSINYDLISDIDYINITGNTIQIDYWGPKEFNVTIQIVFSLSIYKL